MNEINYAYPSHQSNECQFRTQKPFLLHYPHTEPGPIDIPLDKGNTHSPIMGGGDETTCSGPILRPMYSVYPHKGESQLFEDFEEFE